MNEAAEAARLKVLGEDEEPAKSSESQLEALRKELAEIQARIDKKSTAALLKQKQKLEDAIEKAEAAE